MGKSGEKVHAIFSYTICNFSEILKLFPNKKLQSKRKKEALLALQSLGLVVTTPDSALTGGGEHGDASFQLKWLQPL